MYVARAWICVPLIVIRASDFHFVIYLLGGSLIARDPTGFGDPTRTGTGHVSPSIGVSGPGRGLEFGDRGRDGCAPPVFMDGNGLGRLIG